MGELVVKDAAAKVLYRASPEVSGSAVSLHVPVGTLTGAAYPVLVDPTISPVYPVSEPALVGAVGDQHTAAVASDGTGHLVVWSDSSGQYGRGSGSDIRAARLGADGTPLDPGGVTVAAAPYSQAAPEVAWSDGVFLVVWQHDVEEATYQASGVDRISLPRGVDSPHLALRRPRQPVGGGARSRWAPGGRR